MDRRDARAFPPASSNESFVPEDAPNEDLNYGPTPEGAYGPGQVTVYKTVNHIQHVGVLNIGPQFNFGASNFPSWQQQAQPPEFDFAAHIDKCKSSVKMIENKDIEAIAPKIEERDLYQLGHDLDIPSVDELLNSWTSEPSDYSIAHRLLLYWTQVKDGEATVQVLTEALERSDQKEAIMQISPFEGSQVVSSHS